MKKGYIYKITSPSNKVYIGQTINLKKRIENYKYPNIKLKQQPKIYNSINKYGWGCHKFEVIEECSIELLNELERYYQDFFEATNRFKGLNCRLTSTSDKSGSVSKETSTRMSLSRLGKKLSDEHKNNISKSLKGKKKSIDHIKKCVESRILNGRSKHSEETKQKIRLKNIEYHKNLLINHNKGRKLSYEHKLKISAGNKGRITRNKIILNTYTGIYYDCIQDSAESINMKRQTLNAMLSGQNPNKTNFIYT